MGVDDEEEKIGPAGTYGEEDKRTMALLIANIQTVLHLIGELDKEISLGMPLFLALLALSPYTDRADKPLA